MDNKNQMTEKELRDREIEEELRNQEEDKRKIPPFLLLALFTTVVTLAALGLSFSAIELLESNETINTIISTIRGDNDKDKYIITYSENITDGGHGGSGGSGSTMENRINLVNQFPTPDSQGKLFQGTNYIFNFTLIIGSKTKGAYYEITASELDMNTLNPNYVKVYLTKNGEEVDFSLKNNGKVKVYTDYKESKYPETKGKVIYKDYISESDAERGKIEFALRMWVSEDAVVDSNFNNKTFGLRVNTYAAFIKNK